MRHTYIENQLVLKTEYRFVRDVHQCCSQPSPICDAACCDNKDRVALERLGFATQIDNGWDENAERNISRVTTRLSALGAYHVYTLR